MVMTGHKGNKGIYEQQDYINNVWDIHNKFDIQVLSLSQF